MKMCVYYYNMFIYLRKKIYIIWLIMWFIFIFIVVEILRCNLFERFRFWLSLKY